MPLGLTKNDDNRMYAELNSPRADSTTTERPQEPGHFDPKATTVKYRNCMEMKAYANMQVVTISYTESFGASIDANTPCRQKTIPLDKHSSVNVNVLKYGL